MRSAIVVKNFESQFRNSVQHIGDDMAEGAAIIDGGLPALCAVMAGELCAAILAVRQSSRSIFASTEPAPAGSSLDGGNRCVAEDNLCRFIGHISSEITKRFSLRRLRISPAARVQKIEKALD